MAAGVGGFELGLLHDMKSVFFFLIKTTKSIINKQLFFIALFFYFLLHKPFIHLI